LLGVGWVLGKRSLNTVNILVIALVSSGYLEIFYLTNTIEKSPQLLWYNQNIITQAHQLSNVIDLLFLMNQLITETIQKATLLRLNKLSVEIRINENTMAKELIKVKNFHCVT